MTKLIALIAFFALFAAAPAPGVTDLKAPAAAGSEGPNLAVGKDGKVYLSWLEPGAGTAYALRYSVRGPQGWSAPKTIAQGSNWFVSSVDFPQITVLSDGTLAADWFIATNGPASEAYDINLAFSKDGTTWSKPVAPHKDRKKRQHGFPSLLPTADGKLAAIWLDGRNMPDEVSGNMALMYTTIAATGALGAEVQIDNRTCECCKTSMAATPDGLIAAYRDRSDKEIRDISIARFVNGKWSAPVALSKDNWEIDGCPINGPAISSNGKNVAVAWFTAPDDKPAVYVTLSSDGGKAFGNKVRVDGGNPVGKVDIVTLPSGESVVSWVERIGGGRRLQVRKFAANGTASSPIDVSRTYGPGSGFPKMVVTGNDVMVAWGDSTDPAPQVRTAIVSF